MAEQSSRSEVAEAKLKTFSRSSFPRAPLSDVLKLAQSIYGLGEGDPVPRLLVFDRLNKSPESGTSRMMVTASNAYGLTTGSYSAERLGITNRGKTAINGSPDEKKAAIIETLMSNSLFVSFYENYKNKKIPDPGIGADYLKQAAGLNDKDAKQAYEIFVKNLKTYGLTREMSGRETIIPVEMVAPSINADEVHSPKEGSVNENTRESSSGERSVGNNPSQTANFDGIVPQFNFNIQVQIPDNASPETYNAIFKSMSEHLLRRIS
ncbi:MAG: hypothetical protein JWL85_378 [Candidatus Saccharibacteria bacterium]|nr:hypothetical protein [Candidatus Saccharibacteria bacterium]